MTSEAPPRYIYKILPSAPLEPLPKEFPLSELDRNDGFIHLSTSTQVPKTADLFFQGANSLWIVKLEFSQFAGSIKWEDGFPHLYGNFGADNVDSVEKFDRASRDQTWGQVLKSSSWLE
ncbi:hypothetical protein NM208_g11268 [Fusarium decemcellulare]|uniref:Uncharacterized protein n=1 Tax=Fusarium decemcellulare TaxID=57161 RepID=A0ACC1RUY6_9HYPO|nr:hypothetical protein NM208_g11268 [Fusarium decemcellulare]